MGLFNIFTGKGDPKSEKSEGYQICLDHDFQFVKKRFSSMGGGAYRIRGIFKCSKCPREEDRLTDRYQYSTQQNDRSFVLGKPKINDGKEMLLPNNEDGALPGPKVHFSEESLKPDFPAKGGESIDVSK